MLAVSNAFNEAFKQDYRDIKMRIKINDVTYTDSDIISFNYNAGSIVGESFAIGSTFANTVKLTLCKIVEGLKQLDEVVPEMGIVVANGSTEWVKLGTFIISEQVNPDRNENRTSIECTDRMIMLDDPYESKLTYPAKIRDVALEIANLAGVEVDQVSFSRLMQHAIQKPVGYTFRQALGLIAQFEAGYACFDRNGLIAIRQLEDKNFEVTPAEYFQKGLVKNELIFRPAGIQVKVNGESEEDKVLKIGNEKGSVIRLENKVMTDDLLKIVYDKIKDINYYPYSLNWRGNPAVEVGDWLRVTDLKGNQFKIPNLSYSLEYKGGLTAISTVETVASNEVRFAYKGILDQVVEYVDNVIKIDSGNNVFYGIEEPPNPKEGDVWFKYNGPDTEIWVYEKIGEPDIFDWVLKISSAVDDTIKDKIEELEIISKENAEKADQALLEAEKSREEAKLARQEAFDSNTIARSAEQDALTALALGDGNRTDIKNLEGEQKLTNVKVEGNTVNILSLHSNAESLNLSLGKLESDIADKITAVVIEYYESISETSLIGGFWTELPPKKQDDNYIFTRNKIIYSGKIEYKPSENGVLMSGKDAKTNYIHTAYADNSDGTEGFTFEGSEESFIVKNYDSNTSDKWKTVTINKPKPKYVTIDILYKDENNYIFKRESEEYLEGSTQSIFVDEVDGYQIEGESYKKIIATEGTVVEFYFRKKIVENNFLVDDGYPVNMTSKSSGYEEFSAFNFKTNLANCGKVGDKLSLSFKVDRVASSGSYFLIKTNGLSDLSGWLSYGELKVGERYTVTFDFKSEYASATTSTSINFLLTGMKSGDITSVSEPKLINLSSIKVKAYQKNTKLFSEIVLNSEFSEEILVTEVYMSSAFLNNTCMYSLEIDSNEDVRIKCYFVDEFDNYYDTFYSPYTRTGFLEIRLKPTTKTKKMKFLLVGKDNKEATVKFKKSQFEIGDSRHEWLSYGESIEIGGYKEYIGTYTDFNEQASTDPSKYFWRWNPRREDLISQAEFVNFEANYKGFQTTVTSDITGLQSQQTQMAGQISSVVKDVNGLETEVTQLSDQWAVTAQEVKTIDGIVSQQQSTIAVLTSQIDLKVNVDEVISRINLSPEQILIKSKLIHLSGQSKIDDAIITSAMIKEVSADKLTAGEIDASIVRVINVEAENIVGKEIKGISLTSISGEGYFNVQGSDAVLYNARSAKTIKLSDSGIKIYDRNNRLVSRLDDFVVNTRVVGTATTNIYLATGGNIAGETGVNGGEVRAVEYLDEPGDGQVTSYKYTQIRARGFVGSYLNANTPIGETHVYLRPKLGDGEVRVTASGSVDQYQDIRVREISANVLQYNGLSAGVGKHVYIRPRHDGEVYFTKANTTNDTVPINAREVRATAFTTLLANSNLYLGMDGELRVTGKNLASGGISYKPVRASAYNNGSLAEYKQFIRPYEDNALDLINQSTVYTYQLRNRPEVDEIGLVIGDGYDITRTVVDGDGVNQYRMSSLAWKAIQELSAKIEQLEKELRNVA